MRKNCEIIINSANEIGTRFELNSIARHISSPVGRVALAQSMTAPIRRHLDYNRISRKIFLVDPLPQGALPVYKERVFKHNYVIINSRNDIGTREQLYRFINGTRVALPIFTIISNPTINISEIKSRRFNIIDRSIQKAKTEIMSQKDYNMFNMIDDATLGISKEVPKKKSIFDNIKSWGKKLLQYLDI